MQQTNYGNRRRTQNGNENLTTILLALAIGYIDDIIVTGTKYYYQDTIVEVNKKYQCPKHCGVEHIHSVYFDGYGITIDKNQLGKRYKQKKSRKKK